MALTVTLLWVSLYFKVLFPVNRAVELGAANEKLSRDSWADNSRQGKL